MADHEVGGDIEFISEEVAKIIDDSIYHVYGIKQDENKEILLLKGGKGGFGNHKFKSSKNIAPKKVADLHKFWFAGDIMQATKIDSELFSLNNALFLESNPCPVKYAAHLLGMCEYEIRLPLVKINKVNEIKIKEEIKNLSLSFS